MLADIINVTTKKGKNKSHLFLLIYFISAFFLLSIAVIPASSYGKAIIPGNNIPVESGVVKVAIVLPTEGRLVYFSRQFINGLLLSLKNSGGSKIKYVTVNLPADADSVTIGYMFASLANKGISAIVGPIFAGQLKYFASESVKFKIPVITPSPFVTKKDISPFVYSYGMTLKQEIKTEMEYAGYKGINNISVIYPQGGYGRKLLAYITHFAIKYGVNILNVSAYNDKTVDFYHNFNSIVKFSKVKIGDMSKAEEARLGVTPYDIAHGITKMKPNIPFKGLFVIGGRSKLKLILTQLMYYNITGFTIFGLSSFNSRSFIENYGFYMQGVVFPDGFFKYDNNKIVKEFVARYKKYYGKIPNILSAEGYDIGGILIKAAGSLSRYSASSKVYPLPGGFWQLGNLQNESSGGSLFSTALSHVKSFKGVCGVSRLSGNIFKKNLYLFKFKKNKIYILKSPF